MKVVAYYRVSTARQGRSGLGLEAQRAAVSSFCATKDGRIVAELTEIESGKRNDRPQLAEALQLARLTGSTLVVAKLDRLSRNVAFLATLIDSRVAFVAADMPEANEITLHIMAVVAQAEVKAISRRVKDALAAAKARGTKLGNPNGAAALRRAGQGNHASILVQQQRADLFAQEMLPILKHVQAQGHTTLQQMADELNARGFKARRGGRWYPETVRSVFFRVCDT